MTKNNQVEVEFLVKDEVSKALTNIKKNLQQAGDEAKKGSKPVFDLGQVLSTAVGFSAASMISKTTEAVKEFISEGIHGAILYEEQLMALEFQTNQTADALLEKLSVAVEGTVNSLNLAGAANRALALGLQKDDLPGLFSAASARAKIMGISVTQAVGDIVTGIGRASPLILDNLGIVFDLDKTYKDYAATLGVSVEALTKLDKTRALTLATIESTKVAEIAMNSAVYTTGVEVERTKAKVDDLKTTLGGEFLVTLGKVLYLFEDINVVSNQNNPALRQNADAIKALASQYEELQKEQKSLIETQKTLRAELEGIGNTKLQSEIDAEREINRLNLQKLEAKQKLDQLGANPRVNPETSSRYGDKSINDNAQLIIQYNEQERLLAQINVKLEEQQKIKELGSAQRAVATDEAITGAENKGTLDKEGTTLEEIKKSLQDRIDKQVEYNNRLAELNSTILPSYVAQIDMIDAANERIEKNTARIAQNYSSIERALVKISLLTNGGSLSYI